MEAYRGVWVSCPRILLCAPGLVPGLTGRKKNPEVCSEPGQKGGVLHSSRTPPRVIYYNSIVIVSWRFRKIIVKSSVDLLKEEVPKQICGCLVHSNHTMHAEVAEMYLHPWEPACL